jgi:hypothetical protein
MRNWHKFRRLPRQEKRLLVEASLLLPLTALAIRAMGLRRWRSALLTLSRINESNPAVKDKPGFLKAHVTAEMVKIAAWHGLYRGNCLEQSLVLWWLLARQGIESELRFGARKCDDKVEAHAWVEVERVPLNERLDVNQIFSSFHRTTAPSELNPQ